MASFKLSSVIRGIHNFFRSPKKREQENTSVKYRSPLRPKAPQNIKPTVASQAPPLPLSEILASQNQQFLNAFLSDERLTNKFSAAETELVLNYCSQHGIYLPELSPLVRHELIQKLVAFSNLASDQNNSFLDEILNGLLQAASKDTQYTAQQHEQAYGNRQHILNTPSITQRLQAQQQIPQNYLLKTEDLIYLLPDDKDKPFAIVPGVITIDRPIQAAIEEQLLIHNKQAVYVFTEQSNHWQLSVFTKNTNDKVEQTHYNPPGDGRCGDHTICYFYNDVKTKFKIDYPHYQGYPQQKDPDALRQAHITQIKQQLAQSDTNHVSVSKQTIKTSQAVSAPAIQKPWHSIVSTVSTAIQEPLKTWFRWLDKITSKEHSSTATLPAGVAISPTATSAAVTQQLNSAQPQPAPTLAVATVKNEIVAQENETVQDEAMALLGELKNLAADEQEKAWNSFLDYAAAKTPNSTTFFGKSYYNQALVNQILSDTPATVAQPTA